MFAAEVGYPIILKPRAGAGASGTQRVDNDRELESAIVDQGLDRGASVAAEEFIEGHEGFYDTISIGGRVVHEFISHYYPNVLEAMRTRWISPQIVTTNRVDAPGYNDLRRMGQKVIEALGITTSPTHMEWFFGPKGLKFSEIGCRPPGVGVWDLYAAANEFDIYREWAMAVVHGRPGQQTSRRYSAGMIALRPNRDGPDLRLRGPRAGLPGLRRLDHRLAHAASGLPDRRRRGRLHGERLDPHEAPRLRPAAAHARPRRPHDQGPGAVGRVNNLVSTDS